MAESHLQELAHRMRLSGRNHKVVRFVLLEHQPHRPNILLRMTPVAVCVKVAKLKVFGEPQFDLRHMRRDLPRDELEPAPRALVIEENPARRVQPVGLAVVPGQFEPRNL